MTEKLDMKSMDITQENIKKIQSLFPSAVTEVKKDGKVQLAIDFDILRQELSDSLIEEKQERYQMTWPDKSKSKLLASSRITSTLRPDKEKSVDFDNTKNLYIEGDNLDVLKLLRETYLGKVKMIYIDPPYNTGNDFVYNDDFAQSADEYAEVSGEYDDQGNRLVQNTSSNGRFHTDWLNMMFPRLIVAKDLLTDNGALFISIDDNEVFNLKKICDEIFGSGNFVAQLAVQLNPRGRNLDLYVAKTHESVLIYVKNYNNASCLSGVEKEGRMVDEYNQEDERGKYREIGLRNRNQAFNPQTRPNLYYPLYVNPKTHKVSTQRTEEFCDEIFPDAPDGTQTCWTWMKSKVESENEYIIAEKSGNEWRIFRKDYLIDENGSVAKTLVKSLWADNTINNDYGKKAIKDLFGSNIMSFPKSPELMKKIISIGAYQDDIIMDFFSGAATTAHAVMQLNAEDGGNRKFIMVQLPEVCDEKSEAYKAGYKTICDIGEERIRRAGKKIKEDAGLTAQNLDTGFRVLKLDSSNMQDVYYNPVELSQSLLDQTVDNVKMDRTPLDLLFQVMLDLGIELSAKIEAKTAAGKTFYVVGGNELIACFDDNLTNEVITEIAKLHPIYAAFKDKSFATDSVGINNEQIFKTFSPVTVVKVI